MSLKEMGFRFVLQDGIFSWAHPSAIKENAIDCTDMPDDQFNELVKKAVRGQSLEVSK